MTDLQIIFLSISAACSITAGWSMGRAIPHWKNDNDTGPTEMEKTIYWMGPYFHGCVLSSFLMLRKPTGYFSFFFIAFVLALVGFWDDIPPMRLSRLYIFELFPVLLKISLFTLAMFFIGYLPSRLTDKRYPEQ